MTGLLEPDTIKPFKVIFVTEPDLPSAGATALGEWVKAGGTLITVSNAGTHDQYHEASTVSTNSTTSLTPLCTVLLLLRSSSTVLSRCLPTCVYFRLELLTERNVR